METVAPGLGRPRHKLVDGAQRAFADRLAIGVLPVAYGTVDGGEPLRGVAVDDRRLGAPAMRIAVLDLAARQETADLYKLVDDRLVGVALLALAVKDVLATEEGQIFAERAVFHHVVGDDLFQHPEAAVKLELLHPVAGRAMDKAGALLIGDEISGAEIAQVIPFAFGAFGPGEGVLE